MQSSGLRRSLIVAVAARRLLAACGIQVARPPGARRPGSRRTPGTVRPATLAARGRRGFGDRSDRAARGHRSATRRVARRPGARSCRRQPRRTRLRRPRRRAGRCLHSPRPVGRGRTRPAHRGRIRYAALLIGDRLVRRRTCCGINAEAHPYAVASVERVVVEAAGTQLDDLSMALNGVAHHARSREDQEDRGRDHRDRARHARADCVRDHTPFHSRGRTSGTGSGGRTHSLFVSCNCRTDPGEVRVRNARCRLPRAE